MADANTPQPSQADIATTEEAAFYHETALNATWSGSRLAIGGLSFLYGAFLFSYFYLRSLNSSGLWLGPGYRPPSTLMGTFVMMLVLTSAAVHYAGLVRIKAGDKRTWQILGLAALVLGLGAVTLQILELLFLPFSPASSGFSSVFVGFYPVFLVSLLAGMFWLETLLARSRFIPGIAFVEQPPTYAEAFTVQRFQARLSAFTLIWNYLALVGVLFWVLFYVIP
jgi:heme/copper-type cytochrome/quinol oxidase subunit 3